MDYSVVRVRGLSWGKLRWEEAKEVHLLFGASSATDEYLYENDEKVARVGDTETVPPMNHTITVGASLTPDQIDQLVMLPRKFRPILAFGNELGHFNGLQHDIGTVENRPISSHSYGVLTIMQQVIRKQIKEWLTASVITSSLSPWSSYTSSSWYERRIMNSACASTSER